MSQNCQTMITNRFVSFTRSKVYWNRAYSSMGNWRNDVIIFINLFNCLLALWQLIHVYRCELMRNAWGFDLRVVWHVLNTNSILQYIISMLFLTLGKFVWYLCCLVLSYYATLLVANKYVREEARWEEHQWCVVERYGRPLDHEDPGSNAVYRTNEFF